MLSELHFMYSVFLTFAVIHTLVYTFFRHDIFEWDADPNLLNDPDKRRRLKEKREIIEEKKKRISPRLLGKSNITYMFSWVLRQAGFFFGYSLTKESTFLINRILKTWELLI